MKATIAILLLTVALVACAQQAATGTTVPQGGVQQTTSGDAQATPPATAPEGTGNVAAGNTVEINMTAKDFAFAPNTITVHQGDHVIIHIVDSDEDHGLAIQGYDTQVQFGAGAQDTKLDFIANKTGTFTFFCNVPCGSGHRQMKGTLIVV